MLRLAMFTLLISGFATQAHATTLQEFEAQPSAAQGHVIYVYVKALASKAEAQDPRLGQAIIRYFMDAPSAQEPPPGMADLTVQMMAADRLAKEGKADLAKIQVEAMIAYVVRQHFRA